jgi:nitroreductase/NAD-dependent dihydropyrimidine dehydrogenase PreA subunit
MSLNFTVDPDRCTGCERCVADCPASIIKMAGDGRPGVSAEDEANCVFCQHCLAICPQAAVSIRSLLPENSHPLAVDAQPRLEQMDLFVRGRRSVRQYQDANVDPALIDRLLDAVAHAPTGVNCRNLTFTVIEDRAVLARLRERLLQGLADANDAGRLPEGVKRIAGLVLSSWKAGRDLVFRDAPHLLIVSSPANNPCPQQDVIIALAYFELLAQSAGLGTVWCGYVHRLLECLPDHKHLLDLPQGHIYYPMLFGLPAVQYARTVQRSGSATIRKITS